MSILSRKHMWYNGVRGPTTPSHANNVRHRLPWAVWPRFESMVLRVSIKRTSCQRCIAIKKGCGMAEKGSERVKRRKKTEDDAKGKGKEKETDVELEEAEEEETVSERLGRMETIMKGMVKKQEELIAQQRWLKWRGEEVWGGKEGPHEGTGGVGRVGGAEETRPFSTLAP